MRRQYHFRDGSDGLRAWDVQRLLDRAKDLEPTAVDLASIAEIDESYWYAADDPPPTCRDVVEHSRLVVAADLSFPILLSPDGRLMDGMHRVAKAMLEGRSQIMAVRLPALPQPDHVGVDPADLPYDEP